MIRAILFILKLMESLPNGLEPHSGAILFDFEKSYVASFTASLIPHKRRRNRVVGGGGELPYIWIFRFIFFLEFLAHE